MPLVELSVGDAGIAAVLGYLVVFVGLILLLIVVLIVGKVMVSMHQQRQTVVISSPDGPTAVFQTTSEPEPQRPAAPGSAGEVKLYDVPDKEAAMLMAIVADKMGKPLNELRFKSMKEVK